MASTAKGYRYPSATEPIAAGAQAIKNLANDCNPKAGSQASGTLTLSPANSEVANKTVTYPAGRFANQPFNVVTTGNSNWFGAVGAPSLASFNCYPRHYQRTPTTNDIKCYWIARW